MKVEFVLSLVLVGVLVFFVTSGFWIVHFEEKYGLKYLDGLCVRSGYDHFVGVWTFPDRENKVDVISGVLCADEDGGVSGVEAVSVDGSCVEYDDFRFFYNQGRLVERNISFDDFSEVMYLGVFENDIVCPSHLQDCFVYETKHVGLCDGVVV